MRTWTVCFSAKTPSWQTSLTIFSERFFRAVMTMSGSSRCSAGRDTALGFAKTSEEASKEKIMKALQDFLRPEFIARVDEIIVFNSLSEADFVEIARLMLEEYIPTLDEKRIKFTFDDNACAYLAKKSCNGKSGARDLRSTIRREVEEKIAEAMIQSQSGGLSAIHVTSDGESIQIQCL